MGSVVSMEEKKGGFNPGGRWAPLKNVLVVSRAMQRAINRSPNLPGIVVHYGLSGLGKSMAAQYCAHKFDGFLVECRSYFTRKSFAAAILREMGVRASSTVSQMMDQIAEQLDLSQRPLIIDETDHLVDRKLIELLRDLHEGARTTIMLIGEGEFPGKLYRASPRFHNRVLEWVPAEEASMEDVHALARFYCPEVLVADDLLQRLITTCEGGVRYICVNLDRVREVCQQEGLKKLDLSAWGKRAIYSAADARVLSTTSAKRRAS